LSAHVTCGCDTITIQVMEVQWSGVLNTSTAKVTT
jgi:hypothetical protein